MKIVDSVSYIQNYEKMIKLTIEIPQVLIDSLSMYGSESAIDILGHALWEHIKTNRSDIK